MGDARASEAVLRAILEREMARLEPGDPFIALGLGHDADDRAVRAAFLAATKRLHPNRFARTSAPVRTLANEVFLRIKDAYGAIETAEGRERVLSRMGKVPVAPAIGEGSGAVRVGFPNLPRVVLTPATGTRLPDVPRPPSEPAAAPPPARAASPPAARAPSPAPRATTPTPARPAPAVTAPPRPVSRAPTAPGATSPQPSPAAPPRLVSDRERRAEQELHNAIRKLEQGFAEIARRELHRLAAADPGERRYRVWLHHARGCEAQQAGRLDEARAEYRRALDLDESFQPALAALAGLEPGGDRPSGGLLSRLFRK